MTIRWMPRHSLKRYLPWGVVFLAPLVINSLVWALLVGPGQQRVQRWRDAEALVELKPWFDQLLPESHQMLMDAERTGFTNDDPTAVTQAIERLAGRHRVQLGTVNAKLDQGKSRHASATSLTVDVSGRFSKLAHWMSDVEAQSGLQIESWTLTAGEKPGDAHKLTVNLTAFLREA